MYLTSCLVAKNEFACDLVTLRAICKEVSESLLAIFVQIQGAFTELGLALKNAPSLFSIKGQFTEK